MGASDEHARAVTAERQCRPDRGMATSASLGGTSELDRQLGKAALTGFIGFPVNICPRGLLDSELGAIVQKDR